MTQDDLIFVKGYTQELRAESAEVSKDLKTLRLELIEEKEGQKMLKNMRDRWKGLREEMSKHEKEHAELVTRLEASRQRFTQIGNKLDSRRI